MAIPYSVYLFTMDGYLGCFHLLALVTNAMNVNK